MEAVYGYYKQKASTKKAIKAEMNGLAKVKKDLHRLVDELPDEEIHSARRYLEYLWNMGDPLYRSLMEAPVDDEPITEEDRKAMWEAY